MNTHTRRRLILSAAGFVFTVSLLWGGFAVKQHATDKRVDALLLALQDPDARGRAATVKELGRIGPGAARAVPTLLDMLRRDQSQDVYSEVMGVLWRIGPEPGRGFDELAAAMKHPDASVRTSAAFALGYWRPHWLLMRLEVYRQRFRRTAVVLAAGLKDDDHLTRWMAAVGVMRFARPLTAEVVPELVAALEDKDDWIRLHAVYALSRIGPEAKAAVPALVGVLRPRPQRPGASDEEQDIARGMQIRTQTAASLALGKIGPPAVEALVEVLRREEDKNAAEYAAWALGDIGPASVPHLLALMRDAEARTRLRALGVLGRRVPGDAAATEALLAALKDEDAEVRRSAASKFWDRQLAPAVPPLTEALRDADDEVRHHAAYALAKQGPRAKTAVPVLLELVNDEKQSRMTREAAALAVTKLDPAKTPSLPPDLREPTDWPELVGNIRTEPEKEWKSEVNPMYR